MLTLYALGSNGSGQLGIAGTKDTCEPQKCLFNPAFEDKIRGSPIQKITGGGNHTLLLYENGVLLAAGRVSAPEPVDPNGPQENDRFGELPIIEGNGVTENCSALWEASVVVMEDDRVVSDGFGGDRGELGRPSYTNLLQSIPPAGATIVDIVSSVSHTVVVLSNGEVCGWGDGRRGQLGQPAELVWEPRRIQGLDFKVIRAVCGREFTYFVGDPSAGHHAIFGSDKRGVRSTAPVALPEWKDVGASWGSIFVLMPSGEIVSWGRDDHGQLAPAGLPSIEKIAVGSEHVVALTNEGNVVSWGWGEHGNCGQNVDKDGDVKGTWNEIPNNAGKVVGVGAGCATSFFWTDA